MDSILFVILFVILIVLWFSAIISELERRTYFLKSSFFASDSKVFKIGDPVAVIHGGRLSFWYIASISLSLRPDKYSNLYVLEKPPCPSADYHFHDDELRHPTPEELEKYFRK